MKEKLIGLSTLIILGAYAFLYNKEVEKISVLSIREVMIPMEDGIKLAADLYLPTNISSGDQLPVLLEYTPYRKNDSRGSRYGLYSYFVTKGYVVARVDIRGTGNSEGRTIPYEYSEIELNDCDSVIAWLAKQNWSNGKVGMFGISWGGFNSIQMAVRKPPALKAFVALMATEDLYQEDVHYMDGIIHIDSWMMSNDLSNAMPGAPEFHMDEEWLRNRFDLEPSMFKYMEQQRDGPFWDRASSRDKYDQIQIPGYFIGGWYDGYRNSLPRMLEHVKAPVKAIIGPWDHYFPHDAWPEPKIEWRREAVRWFDKWLKDIDTGILDEPRFAVFVRDWHPPGPGVDKIRGYWRWEEGWPIERSLIRTFYAMKDHGLSMEPSKKDTHRLVYKPSVGLEGGGPVMWWGNIPPDQQRMDDYSLTYDSQPLDSAIEILGMPVAFLKVSSDASRANWVVRICDVSPDGSVTQVGGAAFNGTHRNSARDPEDLIPGKIFPLEIELHFTSWVFPKGHRIRLSINNAQWPMLWPTPYSMTTSLSIGGVDGARVELPVIPKADRPVPKFQLPNEDPVLSDYSSVNSGNVSGYAEIKSIQRNEQSGDAIGIATNTTSYSYPWGIEHFEEKIEHRTSDINPAETSVIGTYALTINLEDRKIRMEQNVELKSDLNNFYLNFIRILKLNEKILHEKEWNKTFQRDFQ